VDVSFVVSMMDGSSGAVAAEAGDDVRVRVSEVGALVISLASAPQQPVLVLAPRTWRSVQRSDTEVTWTPAPPAGWVDEPPKMTGIPFA
jgi:hypothetical protein